MYIANRESEMHDQEGSLCPGPFPNKTIIMDETDNVVDPYINKDWLGDAPGT
jgi:hypothetical protein